MVNHKENIFFFCNLDQCHIKTKVVLKAKSSVATTLIISQTTDINKCDHNIESAVTLDRVKNTNKQTSSGTLKKLRA